MSFAMDRFEMIQWLRSQLKEMAILQKKAKRARKTTIDKKEREALLKELGIEYPEAAGYDVFLRRAKITAYLNHSLMLRGRTYRHGVRKGLEYSYKKHIKQLEEMMKDEAVA